MVLWKVLKLDASTGPSSGAGAVELEDAADASVGSGHLLHGHILLGASLVELRADIDDAVHLFVVGGVLDVREVGLSHGVQLESSTVLDPSLELLCTVRIAESGDLLRLDVDAGLVDGIHADGIVYECEVQQDAAVVDDLIDSVEEALVLSRLAPCEGLLELAFHFHVHAAVLLEGLPSGRVGAW